MFSVSEAKSAPIVYVKDFKGNIRKELHGLSFAEFTTDSKNVIYLNSDSLCLMNLRGGNITSILGVQEYTLVEKSGKDYLILRKHPDLSSVVLYDVAGHKETIFNNIEVYNVSPDKKNTFLQSKENNKYCLSYLDLSTRTKQTVIVTDNKLTELVFDSHCNQIAFLVSKKDSIQEVYRYKIGWKNAVAEFSTINNSIHGLKISGGLHFISRSRGLLFETQPTETQRSVNKSIIHPNVDIWNYQDQYLQSEQLKALEEVPRKVKILFSFDFKSRSITSIETSEEYYDSNKIRNSNYLLLNKSWRQPSKIQYRVSWKHFGDAPQTIFLIDLLNGVKVTIIDNKLVDNCSISPDEKYVIFFDQEINDYFVYDIKSKRLLNVSSSIKEPLCDTDGNEKLPPYKPYGILGWSKNDESVYVYDQFDIWEINLVQNRPPVNMTKGLGKRTKTIFRSLTDALPSSPNIIDFNVMSTILRSFNTKNKNEGFYSLAPNSYPQKIYEGPYRFQAIMKAKEKSNYIVRRMNGQEPPNLFLTCDFSEFKRLTNIEFQKKFNWYSSELVHWETFDRKSAEGILYKPEDFDPGKKYPVIFTYYEKRSDNLNDFIFPELSNGEMNIPYFVSNGYVVFEPNIYYKIGDPGESAYNSVVSAAKHISSLSWADSTKFGLQGISFGAYETNYIITRTNLFSAASTSAGPTNLISLYDSLRGSGISMQFAFESSQMRFGCTLWDDPDMYIRNSPIFKADRISTPVLIMHNKKDEACPWEQGVEWFTALRRLGKPAWMLQYDNGYHGISEDIDKRDFTVRLTQFFDHYLKGTPAPKWMTMGRPANLKGVDERLELDSPNVVP
jgi:dienelactone hydrolase